MKRISKIFLSLALVVSGLCFCPNRAKADLFGIGDAALLTQQILQYVQDLTLGNRGNGSLKDLCNNMNEGIDKIKNILSVLDNGKQGLRAFNNIKQLSRKVSRTAEDMRQYMLFLSEVGDDFEITRCYDVYDDFTRRTQYVISDVQGVLKSLKNLGDNSENGAGLLESMDNALAHANALIDCVSDECISQLGDLIRERKMLEQGRTVENMSSLVII